MGRADLLIFLIAALADVTALIVLRRLRKRERLSKRVKQSLDTALQCERIE